VTYGNCLIANAKAYLAIRASLSSFDDYIWGFTGGRTLRRRPLYLGGIAQSTRESDAMSKDLKERGFRFVGSTIIYAFMQAVGMVNDHLTICFRRAQVAALPRSASSAKLRRQ